MKTILTTVMFLAIATAAAAFEEPARMNDCLDVSGQLRQTESAMYEVTANVGWRCTPELLGIGLAKMTVNGQPVAQTVKFDASRRFEISAYVAPQPLPIKACVSIEGRAADGRILIVAEQCDLVDEFFIDLPNPIRPQLRQFPIDDRF